MKKRRLRLQTKIMILSTIFSLIIIFILGFYSSYLLTSILERKIGENALNIAKTIALMPEIHEAFKSQNPSQIIQPLAEQIRKEVGAEFVVIGNQDGVRYSHPYPDRLGKQMVGGDNEPVLKEGQAIISKAVGTLGPSLRGKAPIFNEKHQVIGVVSVGFLIEDIKEKEYSQIIKIIGIVILVLFIGTLGSLFLSRNIKKDIFGLEPDEISQLFLQRQTMLESIKEGIIAVDQKGRITMINQAAKELLKDFMDQENHIGKPIKEVIPNTKFMNVLETGKAQYDQEMLIGNEWVVTNQVPMIVKNEVIGAVASFRRKTEIDQLLQELSDHKIYLDTLRAQNHEFVNKLYTISGLLQLGKLQEAIEFITEKTVQEDNMFEFLKEHIADPKMAAFFIGKLTRAEELKVRLLIDPDTRYLSSPALSVDDLITIYGNLIENSLDAVRDQSEPYRKIKIRLKQTETSIDFMIEDWGKGIAEDISKHIFEDGFSTKGDKRGMGLALARSLVNKYNGKISFYQPEHTGVIFEVIIPLK
ncbi:ATP-binding protein [Tepidibacillus sp. LV47]|uniref:ATP-binding protein n=1 Tax=Tepidibacillus sp. LV47 TaxID=3398228 RepID=UPI003AAE1E11